MLEMKKKKTIFTKCRNFAIDRIIFRGKMICLWNLAVETIRFVFCSEISLGYRDYCTWQFRRDSICRSWSSKTWEMRLRDSGSFFCDCSLEFVTSYRSRYVWSLSHCVEWGLERILEVCLCVIWRKLRGRNRHAIVIFFVLFYRLVTGNLARTRFLFFVPF